jgi:putative hydrolase of the HAD superfamily
MRAVTSRGLFLDYGGVLTTSVLDSFAAFCVAEGIDTELFRHVVLEVARPAGSIFHRVEIGAIDQDEFDRELAAIISEAAGKDVSPAGLKQRLFAASTPDERMLASVRSARAFGIKTALVSNSWGGADYPRELFDELFDAVIISGEVGVRKPDPEIYLLAAERAGVETADGVFVDDFRVNVEGAQAVGMMGIVHRDTQQTLEELRRLLGVDLGAPV